MTTTTPAPAAKKTTARKAPVAPPALDFSALTVQKIAPPVRKTSVAPEDNPTLAWISASYVERVHSADSQGRPTWLGGGRVTVVPAANESQVLNLLRAACRSLGRDKGEEIGLAVTTSPLAGKDKGKVEIRFAVKSPKFTQKRAKIDAAKAAAAQKEAAAAAAVTAVPVTENVSTG